MFKISAKTFTKICVCNIIDEEQKLWLRNKDIGEKLGVENIYDLVGKEIKDRFKTNSPTKQQIRECKRHGSELINVEKYRYTYEEIIIPIIMSCRVSTPKFRSKLGFKQHDIMLCKEQSMLTKIKIFSSEKILLQNSVLSYKLNLYFPEHKLAVEKKKCRE